jgi:hypothetical protein
MSGDWRWATSSSPNGSWQPWPASTAALKRTGRICRDDTYNPDSSDKGMAEIIVAKHRNGATAKIRLAFLDHLTRFSNLAR